MGILWDAITYPCLRYLLLVPKSSFIIAVVAAAGWTETLLCHVYRTISIDLVRKKYVFIDVLENYNLMYIVICWACCSDTYHSDKVSAHCYTQHPIIKPRSTKLKGAILVSPCSSDHLFICGQNRICSVSSIMITGSIIKQLQKVCCL